MSSTANGGQPCSVGPAGSDATSADNPKPKPELPKPKPEFQKQKSFKKEENNTPRCTSSCRIRMPRRRKELSALKYLKHLGEKMVQVLQMMSPRRCSPRVTSSERAKPCVAPVDSHRAEAIDDCIEFINSSSSLPRSNSTVVVQ